MQNNKSISENKFLLRKTGSVVSAVGIASAMLLTAPQASAQGVGQNVFPGAISAPQLGHECVAQDDEYTFTLDVTPTVVFSSDNSEYSGTTSFVIPSIAGAKVEFFLQSASKKTGEPTDEEFSKWAKGQDPEITDEAVCEGYEYFKSNFSTVRSEPVELNIPLNVTDNPTGEITDVQLIGSGFNPEGSTTALEYLQSGNAGGSVLKSKLFDVAAEDSNGENVSTYVETYTLGFDERFYEAYRWQSLPNTSILVVEDGQVTTFTPLWSFADAETTIDFESLNFKGVPFAAVDEAQVIYRIEQHFKAQAAKGEGIFAEIPAPDAANFNLDNVLDLLWESLSGEQRAALIAEIQSVINEMPVEEISQENAQTGITVRMKVTLPLEKAKALGTLPIYYQNSDRVTSVAAGENTSSSYVELLNPFAYLPIDHTWAKEFAKFIKPAEHEISVDAKGQLNEKLFDKAIMSVDDYSVNEVGGYINFDEKDKSVESYVKRYNLGTDVAVTYIVNPISDLRNMVVIPFGDDCPTPTPNVPIIPIPIPVGVPSQTPTPTQAPAKESRGMLANTGVPSAAIALLAIAGMLSVLGVATLAIRKVS